MGIVKTKLMNLYPVVEKKPMPQVGNNIFYSPPLAPRDESVPPSHVKEETTVGGLQLL
jgi:hypothetical protein